MANTAWLPDWVRMLVLSAIPLTELRASIPIAFMAWPEWPWWKINLLALAGNMIPVPFVVWLLGPASRFLSRWRIFERFFDWLFERARRRAGSSIVKYEALGLAIFVAIPLPMTGAWSGCIVAYLFSIPPKYSIPSILLGVAAAGAIVTLVTTGAIAGAGFLLGR
jgi:uncharacterized membrane protein